MTAETKQEIERLCAAAVSWQEAQQKLMAQVAGCDPGENDEPMTKAQALQVEGAELTLSGRCVGKLEYVESYGTTLHIFWHDPAGCEHQGSTR